jgi:hypothetical protein
MSITPTELPFVPVLKERDACAPRKAMALANDAALGELAQLMARITELVQNHPEWRRQKPAERMDNILAALRQL